MQGFDNTRAKGDHCEQLALNHLVTQGLTLVEQNFSSRYGEIDIIALDNEELVFVEVKTRDHSLENALRSISKAKQNKLYRTAAHYLTTHPSLEENFSRFDVIIILKDQSGKSSPKITHLKEAFSSV